MTIKNTEGKQWYKMRLIFYCVFPNCSLLSNLEENKILKKGIFTGLLWMEHPNAEALVFY